MIQIYQYFLKDACHLVSIREAISQVELTTRKEQNALQQRINKLYKEAEKFSKLNGQIFSDNETPMGLENQN